MKSYTSIILLALCLLNAGRLPAQTPQVVLNAVFEKPNTSTVSYPIPKGDPWVTAGGLSAFTRGGQVDLTYAAGHGLDGTGGIYGKVVKPATSFMLLSYNNLKLPMFKDSLPLVEPIRSIQLSVDAKIPLNRTLEVYLGLIAPKGAEVGNSAWANRLVLGTIVGTGEYTHFTFSGADIKDKAMSLAVIYIRDLYLNGMTEAVGNLSFSFTSAEWMEGDEFLMDNIKLTISGR